MTAAMRPVRATWVLLSAALTMAPVAGLLLYAWGGWETTLSAALGAFLATGGAVAGLWLMSWAMPKPQAVFLGALVGGILARLLLFSVALALLLTLTEFPPGAFLVGLFVYYAVCQTLEIRALHRSTVKMAENPEGRR